MSEEKTYRIGEVAELLNLKTHVLRFWETEFPQLAPLRTESGQRVYKEEHVAMLRRIQQLLHEQGMTIEGARKVLEGGVAPDEGLPEQIAPAGADPAFLDLVQDELNSIREILSEPCASS